MISSTYHWLSIYLALCNIYSNISSIWVFPKIGVPQNGWFKIENPIIKMADLGRKPTILGTPHMFNFLVTLETPIEFRRLKGPPAPAAFRTALMEGFRKEVHSFNPEVHQGAVEKNFNFGGGGKLELL